MDRWPFIVLQNDDTVGFDVALIQMLIIYVCVYIML